MGGLVMIFIGIDPGVHTGIAVWDASEKKFAAIKTMKIHQALQAVSKIMDSGFDRRNEVKVLFEDARKRKWIPKEKSVAEFKGRAMGAGAAKRDATIWEDFLTDRGIPFEGIAPIKGMTKLSAEQFRQLTGWEGRTSNHARDAAMLVFWKLQLCIKGHLVIR